jgi:2-polyprenyl-6-hydroxyphenyl methylase/3-demethylubiquinone-9 3-methyltransferase
MSDSAVASHRTEIAEHRRFAFGSNWRHFLSTIDEDRVRHAEDSLKDMLEVADLHGRGFLDIGSGSGLFSLAARRLGARVYSFDCDPDSVGCTAELRRRYFCEDQHWTVQEGSILDVHFVRQLGQFDIVYSWGVLHHTGHMWEALGNAGDLVTEGGKLFVAIYNDCGSQSRRWHGIKRLYNRLPEWAHAPFALMVSAPSDMKRIAKSVLRLRPGEYVRMWTDYATERGMSRWHDIIDWVGGFPYEYAKPEEIFDFFRSRQFTLCRMKCGNVGLGCGEFVFRKQQHRPGSQPAGVGMIATQPLFSDQHR